MFILVELAEKVILSNLDAGCAIEPIRTRVRRADSVHVDKKLRGRGNQLIRSDPSDGTWKKLFPSPASILRIILHTVFIANFLVFQVRSHAENGTRVPHLGPSCAEGALECLETAVLAIFLSDVEYKNGRCQ
jgi:hypothetical protein